MPDFEDLPSKEDLVLPSPRTHPLAGKLPSFKMNPRWQQYFGNQRNDLNTKPSRKAQLNLTALAASLGLTPLAIGEVSQGLWRVSYTARATQAASVSSSLEVTVSWIDRGVTITKTSAALIANDVAEPQFGTLIVRVDGNTPISVSTTYASAGGTPMIYQLDVVAEELARDA